MDAAMRRHLAAIFRERRRKLQALLLVSQHIPLCELATTLPLVNHFWRDMAFEALQSRTHLTILVGRHALDLLTKSIYAHPRLNRVVYGFFDFHPYNLHRGSQHIDGSALHNVFWNGLVINTMSYNWADSIVVRTPNLQVLDIALAQIDDQTFRQLSMLFSDPRLLQLHTIRLWACHNPRNLKDVPEMREIRITQYLWRLVEQINMIPLRHLTLIFYHHLGIEHECMSMATCYHNHHHHNHQPLRDEYGRMLRYIFPTMHLLAHLEEFRFFTYDNAEDILGQFRHIMSFNNDLRSFAFENCFSSKRYFIENISWFIPRQRRHFNPNNGENELVEEPSLTNKWTHMDYLQPFPIESPHFSLFTALQSIRVSLNSRKLSMVIERLQAQLSRLYHLMLEVNAHHPPLRTDTATTVPTVENLTQLTTVRLLSIDFWPLHDLFDEGLQSMTGFFVGQFKPWAYQPLLQLHHYLGPLYQMEWMLPNVQVVIVYNQSCHFEPACLVYTREQFFIQPHVRWPVPDFHRVDPELCQQQQQQQENASYGQSSQQNTTMRQQRQNKMHHDSPSEKNTMCTMMLRKMDEIIYAPRANNAQVYLQMLHKFKEWEDGIRLNMVRVTWLFVLVHIVLSIIFKLLFNVSTTQLEWEMMQNFFYRSMMFCKILFHTILTPAATTLADTGWRLLELDKVSKKARNVLYILWNIARNLFKVYWSFQV